MSTTEHGYTENQVLTMEILLGLGTLMYIGLLVLDGYNVFWFLYKQGRSSIRFIKSLYVLATIIIFLRIS